jgi:hypothetical protein
MTINEIADKLTETELNNVSNFDFWQKASQIYEEDCGSCSSFCTGGSCTTCTGDLDTGYITKETYKS